MVVKKATGDVYAAIIEDKLAIKVGGGGGGGGAGRKEGRRRSPNALRRGRGWLAGWLAWKEG